MIKYALDNPIKVLVAIFFVVLFGVQAAMNMPYRLIPNIEYPQITIRTTWTGASPYDMEKEVIDRQERVLKSIPGLTEFESTAMEGRCNVKLTFDLSVNVDDATLLVSNKLDEVKGYPDDIDKPTIRSADSDSFASVELMLTTRDGNPRSVDEYLSYFEEIIKPYIERVQGVADMWYWGGRSKQVQITVDPYKMGAYNISLSQIINAIDKENIDVSAGTRAYGAKDYRFRTMGEGQTPEDIANIVIVSGDNSRLKLGDVAHVDYGYEKKDSFVRYNNKNSKIDYNDIEELNNICDIYIDLCFEHNIIPCQYGFYRLTGITRDTLNKWDNGESRAGSDEGASLTHSDIVKKIKAAYQEFYKDNLTDAPVGQITIANNDMDLGLMYSRGQQPLLVNVNAPAYSQDEIKKYIADQARKESIPELIEGLPDE